MGRRAILQVALLNVAVALMILPIESVLNRIMIQELALPATLVAGLVALRYLTAPLRVVFGRLSDTRPLAGRRRSPYIAMGLLLMTAGLALAPFAAYTTPTLGAGGLLLTTSTFILLGLGVNMVAPLYFAIVAEQSGPTQRPRVIAVMYVLLALAVVPAALLLGRVLEPYTPEKVIAACGALAGVGLLLGVAELWGLEPRQAQAAAQAGATARAVRLPDILRLLTHNADALLFFAYLLLTFIAIEAQEVVLEPYGAQLFAMTPGQTAQLTGFLRLGLLGGLLIGMVTVNRLGYRTVAFGGMIGIGAGLATIIAAGLGDGRLVFGGGVVVLGIGSGILAVTNLALMMRLTDPHHTGLYVGTWTFAQALGVGGATLLGGVLRDAGLVLLGTPFAGYATVFGTEILALVLAVPPLLALSVNRFTQQATPISPAAALAAATE